MEKTLILLYKYLNGLRIFGHRFWCITIHLQPKFNIMRFELNQTVILLNTEYKPAGSATIRQQSDDLRRYEVDYQYPHSEKVEQIWVPVERLLISEDTADVMYLPIV
jgi:hypothetical protein